MLPFVIDFATRTAMRRIVLSLGCLLLAGFSLVFAEAEQGPVVHRLKLDDVIISPVVHEYIEKGIAEAKAANAVALLIELDTPGGLLNSTRAIVKDMMNAEVPIIVYVAPSGSRAGSAGVFITLAAHVAAMAPSTNIGAAHPVNIGGDKPEKDDEGLKELIKALRESREEKTGEDKKSKKAEQKKLAEDKPKDPETPMEEKILNDTVAWVKAIAKERGRNVDWAVKAVTESISVPETEALEKKVIDFVAEDVASLLKAADGKTVKLPQGEVTLRTATARVVDKPLNLRQQILNILINPNIAYILMMLGFYGLLFEITHPGTWVPGVAGVVCLILALYAFHTIPTNYAGLALILLALTLFIAEAFVPSFGLLTVGGIAAMVLGSLFLVDTPHQFMRISLTVIIPVVVATAGLSVFLVTLAVRAHRQQSGTGLSAYVGRAAEAVDPIFQTGKIFIDGEYWDAYSDEMIAAGEKVIILAVASGMKFKVKKV